MHVHWALHSHATMRRITHETSEPRLHDEITLRGPVGMTSSHAHDDTRWELGSVVDAADPRDLAGCSTAIPSTAIPESTCLPPQLESAVTALTELRGATVSFTVEPEPESVTAARHFAVSRLADWGMPELADDVGLVVSELVTNALRHSGTPLRVRARDGVHRAGLYGADPYEADPYEAGGYDVDGYEVGGYGPDGYGTAGYGGYGDPADPLGSAPSAIRLRLGHRYPWLLCGIMDASRAAPRRKEPDYITETGRGLHLVESFSVRWGWRAIPEGKVVWALFRSP